MQRIDSATAAVEVVQAALDDIEVPACVHLADEDRPFWDAVIAARPNVEWNDADLITAATLAKTLRKLELATEIKEIDTLARLVLAIRRSLGLDVRGKDGRASDVAKRRKHAQAIQQQVPKRNYLGLN